jgi:Helix-turn-helix domain
MPLELLTSKDLHEFKNELLHEIKKLMLLREPPLNQNLLKSKDVCRLLKIGPGTLQNMRNKEIIRFKKVGGIIYYRYEDIEMLVGHKKRA